MHDEEEEPTSPDEDESATREAPAPDNAAADAAAQPGYSGLLPPVVAELEKALAAQNAIFNSAGTKWLTEMNKVSKYYEESLRRVSEAVGPPKAVQQMIDLATHAATTTAGYEKWFQSAHVSLVEADWYVQQQALGVRYADTLQSLTRHLDLALLAKLPNAFNPPNWGALSETEVDIAMAILCDEGLPLAWVPRSAIVSELLSAPDGPSRLNLLAARIPEIITDCEEALDEVTDANLKPQVDLMRRALLCLGTVPEGAQALATNVFDTFLHTAYQRGRLFGAPFGKLKYSTVTNRITKVSDDTPLGEFREACVLSPAIAALKQFLPGTSPTPTDYGRHSTIHWADPQHYTAANAAIAVMLATSFLREAQASGW